VETYTIESADDRLPIDPRQLRELRDLLRDEDDLDLGVRLRDRPPARGEQGAIPVALEIITAGAPLGTAFAVVLTHWINQSKVSLSVSISKGKRRVKISAGNVQDAERLLATVERVDGAGPGNGH
jgi:hypothetical protein